jgi:hypothetical protein
MILSVFFLVWKVSGIEKVELLKKDKGKRFELIYIKSKKKKKKKLYFYIWKSSDPPSQK